MIAHKTQTTVTQNGSIELSNLPFQAGSPVEVIVLEREASSPPTFPLRGTFGVMHDPFEPAVALDEWDALK